MCDKLRGKPNQQLNKIMKTFIDLDGNISCNSACNTSWERITSSAPFSRKKLKSNEWRSVVQRFPEESPGLSDKAIKRRASCAERINRSKAAAAKYKFLSKNITAKSFRDNEGREYSLIPKRVGGKFTKEKETVYFGA